MQTIITGAGGMLGRDVLTELTRRGYNADALGHRDLDITNLSSVRDTLAVVKPAVMMNCAAYTNVDGAEESYGHAVLVNGLGPRNLALACRDIGADLMHVSTDYVFDREKETPYEIYDSPNPLNAYGRSKLLGEQMARDILNNLYILRTSWLFGRGGPNFVATMLRLGRGDKKVTLVRDQEGLPTYTRDLATAMADLMQTRAYGTYHVTNSGYTNWYGFAKEIFHQADIQVETSSCLTCEFPRPAKRPLNSKLNPFPLKETIGRVLPPWQDALTRYVMEQA